MSDNGFPCLECGVSVRSTERFCENCGRPTAVVRRLSVPRVYGDVPSGTARLRPDTEVADETVLDAESTRTVPIRKED